MHLYIHKMYEGGFSLFSFSSFVFPCKEINFNIHCVESSFWQPNVVTNNINNTVSAGLSEG